MAAAREAHRRQLRAKKVSVADLDAAARDDMFRLFGTCYARVERRRFDRDLGEKSHVIVLHDRAGVLRGFSTMVVWPWSDDGDPVRILFSGDTVVDPACWGETALLTFWLKVTGALFAEAPETPLYWLLTSMHPRTYRIMPLFYRRFAPVHEEATAGVEGRLAAAVAAARWPDRYIADRGVLAVTEDCERLNDDTIQITPHQRNLPIVRDLIRRNPGFADGEELVCLARLSPDNHHPVARRHFMAGAKSIAGVSSISTGGGVATGR